MSLLNLFRFHNIKIKGLKLVFYTETCYFIANLTFAPGK